MTRTFYLCRGCGHRSSKWLGRCPECGAWDSFDEEAEAPRSRRRRAEPARVAALGEIGAERVERFSSSIEVLDRVLGGGVVSGGAVLVAGEPGIGKSTLLLQVASGLVREGRSALYVTAEESPRQLRLRAERLGCDRSELKIAGETALEPVLETLSKESFDAVLVDSIQALRSLDLESPPGSIGQVRHAADRLVEHAKRRDAALFLVGHVTKEGAIAGPKSLEHLVDTVLSFEGETPSEYRLLRAVKNRFGPTGEVAMFEMRERGLEPVADPSKVLLSRRRGRAPGSAVTPSLQGTRPLLVEVQALVNPTNFPSPRRMSLGVDGNRLTLLLAVLERFGGLSFAAMDVFLNAVGGLSLREPAADLAVAAALVSAHRGTPLAEDAVYFGEVGLLGEVRPVSRTDARLREAVHLRFRRAFLPRAEGVRAPRGMTLHPVGDLAALADKIG